MLAKNVASAALDAYKMIERKMKGTAVKVTACVQSWLPEPYLHEDIHVCVCIAATAYLPATPTDAVGVETQLVAPTYQP